MTAAMKNSTATAQIIMTEVFMPSQIGVFIFLIFLLVFQFVILWTMFAIGLRVARVSIVISDLGERLVVQSEPQ
jgi:hypothetical protein